MHHESQFDPRLDLFTLSINLCLMNGCKYDTVKCLMYLCNYFQAEYLQKIDNACWHVS